MTVQYPYTQNDRLTAQFLDHDFEMSGGSTPPLGSAGGAGQFKQWMDTSTNPPTLRISVVPRATAGSFVAAEWATLGTLDTATRQFSFQVGKLSASTIEITGSGQVFTVDNGTSFFGQPVTIEHGLTVQAGAIGVTGGGITTDGSLTGASLSVSGAAGIGGGITTTSVEINGSGQVFKVDNGTAFFAQNVEMAQSLFVDLGGITVSRSGGLALYAPSSDVQAREINAEGDGSDRGGIAILAPNGAIQSSVSGTAFYAPNGNIIGQSFSASNTINANASAANGARAINIPQGILFTSYNGAQDGGVAIYANAGAVRSDVINTAFYAPNGNFVGVDVVASNDTAASGVFRRSYPIGSGAKGARIECWGGDWADMTFAMSTGHLLVSADGGTSGFNFTGASFSDARLKDNIRDTEVDALEILRQTPVRAFEWNEEGRRLMPHIDPAVPCGLVAQELQETIALAVSNVPLIGDTLLIKDEQLTPYLIRAIQQLADRLDAGGL